MAGKIDLIAHLAGSIEGMSKKTAGEAVDGVFGFIQDQLVDGQKVTIPGFGNFDTTDRKERMGRNPQTKEPMLIKASTGVRFKPGKALKDAVNSK